MSWINNLFTYIKDLTKEDIASEIRERIVNPFFIALFFGWIVINWEVVFTFFNFDEAFSLDDKICRIKTYIAKDKSWWWFKWKLFAKPVVIAFMAIIILSLLKQIALLITVFVNKRVKPIVYKAVDKSKLVLKKDLDDIKGRLYRLRASYEIIVKQLSSASEENQTMRKNLAEANIAEQKATKLYDETLFKLNNVIVRNKKFKNQTPPEDQPTLDDDYYDGMFDLNDRDYEISVIPTSLIKHWRVGIKFSKNKTFPDKSERHQKDYPLFHLEKNADIDPLRVSYYNEQQKNINYETRIAVYEKQKVSIRVIRTQKDTSIMVVDDKHNKILKDWQNIGDYPYCKLFAWGDNRNTFEINSQIKMIPN